METLAEDLLLIALDDDEGTVSWQRSDRLPYALGGALLMDLALQARIRSVDKKIIVHDPSPVGDEILDAALETIRGSNKPHDAKHWVNELGKHKGLKEQLARRLVARGILREQGHTLMWIFHDQRFPTSDPSLEVSIRERIRDVVLSGTEPDERTRLLISLVRACKVTDSLFSKGERKRAEQRVNELVENDRFGDAVGAAISDLTVAVTAAVTAAVFSTTIAPGASS